MKEKLIEMLKQEFFNYKDDGNIHDYCVMCEVGKRVFDMADEELEIFEENWNKEWYEENKWRYE